MEFRFELGEAKCCIVEIVVVVGPIAIYSNICNVKLTTYDCNEEYSCRSFDMYVLNIFIIRQHAVIR